MFSSFINKIRYGDFLGAITAKEMRQGIRKNAFVVQFCIFQITLIFYLLIVEGSGSTSSNSFLYTIIVMLVLLFFANNSNSKEYKPIFHELVTHTKLNSWEFILQKFMALNIQGLLVLVSIMPFIAYKHYYGQINLIQFLLQFALAYACTIFSAPIITLFSATNRNNNPITYFVSLGFLSAIVPSEIAMFSHLIKNDSLATNIANLVFVVILLAIFGFNILSYSTSFISSNLENSTVKRKAAIFSLSLYLVFGTLFSFLKLPDHLLIMHANFLILSGLMLFTSLVEPLHPYVKKYPSFIAMLKYNGWAGSIFISLAVILFIYIFQKILLAAGAYEGGIFLSKSSSRSSFIGLGMAETILNPLPYVAYLMFCWAILSLMYGVERLNIVKFYVGSVLIYIVLVLVMGIISALLGFKKDPFDFFISKGFYFIILIASIVVYVYHLLILFNTRPANKS